MAIIITIIGKLQLLPWGSWCLVSLYLSLVSGIIVGLQYNLDSPAYSSASLDLIVPFGRFFRSVHFYSSQLFFLFGVSHYIAVFDKISTFTTRQRIYLVLTLPVGLLLLFTGYILRADSTGFSAGMIAESIVQSVPLVGPFLNDFLFSIERNGLQRVYLHHVITFDILFLVLAWQHLRKYIVAPSNHLVLLGLILILCSLIAAPLEPESLGQFYITGPWFFLGLQELLRYLHPFIAGVLTPSLLILLLVVLRRDAQRFQLCLMLILLWLAGYGILTYRALYGHGQ